MTGRRKRLARLCDPIEEAFPGARIFPSARLPLLVREAMSLAFSPNPRRARNCLQCLHNRQKNERNLTNTEAEGKTLNQCQPAGSGAVADDRKGSPPPLPCPV